ncbi:hypothetical protein H1R20_g15003, partial [Candolleomyces eurysporus]
MSNEQKPRCRNLVLDAGPLLSLSPLRGLAEKYLTTPQVLAELKDNRAREHFEKLGLLSGVKVEVASTSAVPEETTSDEPTSSSALEASGSVDTAVDEVSQALEATSLAEPSEPTSKPSQSVEDAESEDVSKEEADLEPLNVELTPIKDGEDAVPIESTASEPSKAPASKQSPTPIYDDPSDEDDGEGEWITPENVALHKSRALDLLPDPAHTRKGKKKEDEIIGAGCMTADFAMQNVLLQMGLNLVGLEGKRIEKVKTWVLRCHACYKLCKDSSKKFCPSCGNNTLLRASVTLSSPTASKDAAVMQIHLKPNFQYKLRGTKYSIPAPKPGSAKTGAGTGLILREDQVEYMRAKKVADGKREREEARMMKGILSKGVDSGVNAGVSSWMDPDWMPEILSVGAGDRAWSQES